jgi:monoamine oxidase
MPNEYVVVGGGAAGLAAAYTILSASEDNQVSLFEARDYIGGRAHTDHTIPDLPFELGPLYLQDPEQNPWAKLAEKLGFEVVEEDMNYYMRTARDDGYETVWAGSDLAVNAIEERIEKDYVENQQVPNLPVTQKPSLDQQAEWFGLAGSYLGPFTESAEPWQYLAADRARDDQGEGNLYVKQGVGTLVQAFGQHLKDTFKDRYTEYLSASVYQILTQEQVAVVYANQRGATVQVPARACVVTVPVSVLAAGSIKFDPPLSPTHEAALKALRLGSYKKLAITITLNMPEDIKNNNGYFLYNDDPRGIWLY